MRWLVQKLAIVYLMPILEFRLGRITGKPGSSDASRHIPGAHVIIMKGGFSILTL